MKVSYRGHEIDAHRARSLGGNTLLYWSIFRESDRYECDSSFSTGSDTVLTWIRLLKERIDLELASDDPWLEREARGQ